MCFDMMCSCAWHVSLDQTTHWTQIYLLHFSHWRKLFYTEQAWISNDGAIRGTELLYLSDHRALISRPKGWVVAVYKNSWTLPKESIVITRINRISLFRFGLNSPTANKHVNRLWGFGSAALFCLKYTALSICEIFMYSFGRCFYRIEEMRKTQAITS